MNNYERKLLQQLIAYFFGVRQYPGGMSSYRSFNNSCIPLSIPKFDKKKRSLEVKRYLIFKIVIGYRMIHEFNRSPDSHRES